MANSSAIAPIVVAPSEAWDGNDGPWSTFSIHIGTPPQPARVLVSTTVGETWVISANTSQGGCAYLNNSQTCADSRGALYNVNTSSTWQDVGIFALGDEINLDDYIGDYVNGDYGLETLGLGLPGSGGVTLGNQVVSTIATTDFYLGNLGVTPRPTNFSQFDAPHPSFLASLRQQNKVPSLSFGYSAGNQYRLKKVLGSLTLGGYDASRFIPNDVSFQFAADISRDLVVGLQSIQFSDAKTSNMELLSQGILTFIDATVPHIWLPIDACKAFEKAFHLTYNATVNRYLVNDTLHQQLQTQNASVSFILGNDVNGGQTVNITLPYGSFDLETGPPIVNATTPYFPLRQAANATQYTLGRTFLQESYLIVNYEHSNFSVSQSLFSENSTPQIMSIPSINDTMTKLTKIVQPSTGLPIGAIVGIAVGAVALAIVAGVAAFFLIRRRRRRKAAGKGKDNDPLDPMAAKPEMDGTGVLPMGELYADENKFGQLDSTSKIEMEGSKGIDGKWRAEVEGSKGGAEMEGTKGGIEMEASEGRRYAEMEGSAQEPIEMYAGPHGLYESTSPAAPSIGLLPPPSVSPGIPSPATGSSSVPSRSGAPSPASGSTPRSRVVSWSRRQKPMPRLPPADPDEISSPSDYDSHSHSHRSSRTDTNHPGRRTPNPQYISSQSETSRERRRTPNPQHIASQSETSRERRRKGADALNRRLESRSRTHTPLESRSQTHTPFAPSSPSDDTGPDTGADRWNTRFGSTQRSHTPVDSSSRTHTPLDVPSPSADDSRPNRWNQRLSPPPRSREILMSDASGETWRRRMDSRSPAISSPSQGRTPSPKPPGNFF